MPVMALSTPLSLLSLPPLPLPLSLSNTLLFDAGSGAEQVLAQVGKRVLESGACTAGSKGLGVEAAEGSSVAGGRGEHEAIIRRGRGRPTHARDGARARA